MGNLWLTGWEERGASRARPQGLMGVAGCFLLLLMPSPKGSKETVELSGGVSRALAQSPQI